jgi:hypothetical protein
LELHQLNKKHVFIPFLTETTCQSTNYQYPDEIGNFDNFVFFFK